jgi:uncharacterized membrane protein
MTSSPARRAYIDWVRGIAVLLMIEAHTLDAWTRPAARHGYLYRDATVLGGFAAPLFLWLAGAAVVLAASRAAARSDSRSRGMEVACRRGLEIFILAFLFRLQGFIVTPGGAPVTLFRVDVLNIMGPSMVGVGLLWGAGRTVAARVAACAAAATAIAMLTPIVRATALVSALPVWLQWYARPTGDLTIFTLFPWAGFVFAGGAVGALLAEAGDDRVERRLHVVLGAAGAGLIALGFYAAGRPSLYRAASFWTSSPTWFAIRVGILMVAVSAVYGVFATLAHSRRPPECASPKIDPLARLGRSSLFVYWIHVELVYGYTTWLIRGRLPLWGTAIAYVAFCALMYGAIVLRDRLAGTWRARRVGSTTQTATA